jgi:hypothetical protein
MIAIGLLIVSVLGSGAALIAALVYGIGQWQSTSGKITAIAAGSLLAMLLAFIVAVALYIIMLPAVIALP